MAETSSYHYSRVQRQPVVTIFPCFQREEQNFNEKSQEGSR